MQILKLFSGDLEIFVSLVPGYLDFIVEFYLFILMASMVLYCWRIAGSSLRYNWQRLILQSIN